MNIFTFDNTFEGFLTLIFECYRLKMFPDEIISGAGSQGKLFGSDIAINTDEIKAMRVWDGIVAHSSVNNAHRIYRVFLADQPDTAALLVNYIQLILDAETNQEMNFSRPIVVEIHQLHQKVCREAHRIQMFVRFQKTIENSYFASFVPMYNVLSLCIPHFRDRYADQQWIIYDVKRNYGYSYDLKSISRIVFDDLNVNTYNGQLHNSLLAEDEKLFQKLWKQYFNSICILERKNKKVHRQLLPSRFWKFLPEKNEF